MTLESDDRSGTGAGTGGGVSKRLDYHLPEVDVYYNVSAGGDIHIDVTPDGTNWRRFHTETVATGGGEDVIQFSTVFAGVRVYADSNDFADGDVDRIEMAFRGDG